MSGRYVGDPDRIREALEAEAIEQARQANRDLLADLQRIRDAITANRAWLDRTQAPTQAQVVNHLDRITRQMNAALRLVGADMHAELLNETETP